MIQNITNSVLSRISLITKRNRTNRVRSATNRDSSSIVRSIRLAQRKAMSTDECRNIASSNSSQTSSVTSSIRSKLIETSCLNSGTSRIRVADRNLLVCSRTSYRNQTSTSKLYSISLACSSKRSRTNLNVRISILVGLTTRCNNTINTLS